MLELLTAADYTFVNERLARHYGIPHVKGSHFRRVTLSEDSHRGGLLGHGSVLTVTSYPGRTSPALRGKWVLENLLGTPPPPPPNVPDLKPTNAAGAVLSMCDRMEQHRVNPMCATCHSMMDPPGLALENFDAAACGHRCTDRAGDRGATEGQVRHDRVNTGAARSTSRPPRSRRGRDGIHRRGVGVWAD